MNARQVKSVVSQVVSQARRGEVDTDLAVLAYSQKEVFKDLLPEAAWDSLEDTALHAAFPADLAAGEVDFQDLRKQMWKSKAYHRHMCGS